MITNYISTLTFLLMGTFSQTGLASDFFTTGPATPESQAAQSEIFFRTDTPPPPDPFPIESFGDYGRVNVQELARREQQNPDAFKRGPFVAPNPPLSEIASTNPARENIGLAQLNSAPVRIPIGDFNFDGWPDLLWRHYGTGDNALWFMNQTVLDTAALIVPVPDTAWEIKGTQDFDLDGKTDLLWRHRATGENAVWHMDGRSLISVSSLPSVTDTNWNIAATSFLSVVWRHQKNGQNAAWRVNRTGTGIDSVYILPRVEDLNWQIAVSADFNGDGAADLLWRNYSTGENAIWHMAWSASDAKIVDVVFLDRVADTNWVVVATADYNKDGQPDLVWRHNLTGENAIWLMHGETLSSVVYLPTEKDTNWRIVGPK